MVRNHFLQIPSHIKVRVRDIDYILLQQPMQAAEDQMQWRDSLPALWQHAVGVHICAQLL